MTVLVLNGYGIWVPANIMIDGGSICTLVRDNFAIVNGLCGEKVNIEYEVVGGQMNKLDTLLYPIKIRSCSEDFVLDVEAFGLKKACGTVNPVTMDSHFQQVNSLGRESNLFNTFYK